jgi:predicted outer membrane protein
MRTRWIGAPIGGLALFVFACGQEIGQDQMQNGAPRPESFNEELPVQNLGSGLDAAQVLGVMTVANAAGVEQAMLARQSGSDPLILSFADRIIAAQPHNQRVIDTAINRLGVTATTSLASDQFQQRAQQIMAGLLAQGVDFDRAFLEAQVEIQRETVRMLDESRACRIDARGGSGSGIGTPITCPGTGTGGGTGSGTDAGAGSPSPGGGSTQLNPGSACIGAGGSSFSGGFVGSPLDREVNERALFTTVRSNLISQMNDAFFLSSILDGTTAPPTVP